MTRTLLLAALALQSAPAPSCPAAQHVPLGAVATSLEYWGELVEVCGTFHGRDGPSDVDPMERLLLVGPDQWGHYTGITVSDPELALGDDGRKVCVVGVQRRRDGLSREELRARGMGVRSITDVPVTLYEYVFYPQPCPDGPARG
jgi:hypothetical protein